MILDPDAVEAAAKKVGSTELAVLCITTYLETLADKIEDKVEIRELGPLQFTSEGQPQLPGVDWAGYEEDA